MNPATMEAVFLAMVEGEKGSRANTSSSSIDMISKEMDLKQDDIFSNSSNSDIDMNSDGLITPTTSNDDNASKSIDKHSLASLAISPIASPISPIAPKPKKSRSLFYTILTAEVEGILDEETDFLANTSNIASLMYHKYHKSFGKESVNWLGFYFVRTVINRKNNNENNNNNNKELRLGTFHGKYACVHIPFGKGVCGVSALTRKTQLVPDVHLFPGHIACDEASESEIVIPMIDNDNQLIGVLDIDCPHKNGFDENDQKCLEKIVTLIVQGCKWPKNGQMVW